MPHQHRNRVFLPGVFFLFGFRRFRFHTITVVSEKEIAQTQPLTFAEILDTIPNVDTTSSTSVMYNRVSIRGSQPNQITYLIDGMRQDDLTMGGNRPMGVFADPEIRVIGFNG